MKTKKIFLSILVLVITFVNAQVNTFTGAGAGVSSTGAYNCGFGNSAISINSSSHNSAFGFESLKGSVLTNGGYNCAFGDSSLKVNTTGNLNCAFGSSSLLNNISGYNNVAFGHRSLEANLIGNGNTAIGYASLLKNIGNNNVALGYYSPRNLTSGSSNIFIGSETAVGLLTGSNNVFIGSNIAVNSAVSTSSVAGNDSNATIILSNGLGEQRLFFHSNGFGGIGLGNNSIPQNMLELNGGITNTSGLRFRNYKSNIIPTVTDTKFLTVNIDGDVILRNLPPLGIQFTSACATSNYIPKSTGATTMTCSQIYDNGTSVGIGKSTDFGWITGTTPGTLYQNGSSGIGPSGNFKLDVLGVTRSTAFWATSDKRFKKDIKPIENALKTIEAIDGKTYLWDIEKNKEMNFDNGGHSGFIAQELEKVLPHLVATGNDGFKAVNYMELLPYLVEAIKEQQVQINELKAQVSHSFKTQNGDLLTLENTRIISVSPNPSNDVILVSMNIEKVVQNAKLLVHDINGIVLSTLNINERDTNITKTLQKDNFGKGIYIVSLVVNGKSIDTKKIIFN